MKKNRILTAALAGALSLSLAAPALGKSYDQAGNASTTFSVEVASDVAAPMVRFEVPLYVSMGVIDNTDNVLMPTNYTIRNDSDSYNIGVTGLTFTKLSGTFSTMEPKEDNIIGTSGNRFEVNVTPDNMGILPKDEWIPSHATHMTLSIGGVWAPNTNVDGTPVDHQMDIMTEDSIFYNTQDNTYASITPNQSLNIDLHGKVKSITRAAQDSAAQFRVIFTVSAIQDGQPLVVGGGNGAKFAGYAGDEAVRAGLQA